MKALQAFLERVFWPALTWLETPLVRPLVQSPWRLALAWWAGGLAVLALALAFLFGMIPFGGHAAVRATPIAMKNVYETERAQMREDEPLFRTGLPARALRAWTRVPDSGMFGIARAEVREPLRQILPDIDALARGWAASGQAAPGAADPLIAALKRIDEAQKKNARNSDRSAIEYHRGLVELFKGDAVNAEKRFQDVIQLVDERLSKLTNGQTPTAAQTDARRTDFARLYGVQVAAYYGLGLAQLGEGGKSAEAAASLRRSLSIARQQQALLASPAERLTTGLFDLESDASLVRLDTADIYADLLAATIRQADDGDGGERKAAHEAMAQVLADLRGKAVGAHPRLAANLQIAASLEGDFDGAGAFAPATGEDEAVNRVAAEAQRINAAGVGRADLADYWDVTAAWRHDLAAGDVGSVRKDLKAASAPLREAELRWLDDVLDEAFKANKDIAARARLVNDYNDLLRGAHVTYVWTAHQPLRWIGLSPWLAWPLNVLIGLGLVGLFGHVTLIALRTRSMWRVLHASGYAAEVAAASRRRA